MPASRPERFWPGGDGHRRHRRFRDLRDRRPVGCNGSEAEISDAQISTLFWFNIAIGALLALLCLAAAPVLSAFYHEPKTALVIVAIAPAFVINATGVQHLALLQRHLRYVTLAAIEVGSEIVTAVVAIAMALAGFGYWAVVASVITGPLVITIGAWASQRLATGAAAAGSRRLPDAALWRHSHAQ